MRVQHTRRVLWAFGLEGLLFVTVSLFLGRFPAWLLTTIAVLAVFVPVICYVSIAMNPKVYGAWLDLGKELRFSLLAGIRSLSGCFRISTARKIFLSIGRMKAFPETADDWFSLLLFPFKLFVILILPAHWLSDTLYFRFAGVSNRWTHLDFSPVMLSGFFVSLLTLGIGAILQSRFSERGKSDQTVIVFLLGVAMFAWSAFGLAGIR